MTFSKRTMVLCDLIEERHDIRLFHQNFGDFHQWTPQDESLFVCTVDGSEWLAYEDLINVETYVQRGVGPNILDAVENHLRLRKIGHPDTPILTGPAMPTELWDISIDVEGWLEATTDHNAQMEDAFLEWQRMFEDDYRNEHESFEAFMKTLGYSCINSGHTYNAETDLSYDVIYSVWEAGPSTWHPHDVDPDEKLYWLPAEDDDGEEYDWADCPNEICVHWVSMINCDPRRARYDGPRLSTSTVEYSMPYYLRVEFTLEPFDEDVTSEAAEALSDVGIIHRDELDGGREPLFIIDEDFPWCPMKGAFRGTIEGVPYYAWPGRPHW